jgi:mono/diheme cytochrome c family protein
MKLLFIALFFSLIIAACSDGMHSTTTENFSDKTYSSDGERIYFTGQSKSGRSITAIGGHHHMQIHGGSCVTCHGVNREGGVRMMPWFWEVAPPLTTAALLGDHKDDGHAHDSYDAGSLKKAISEGINPKEEKLDDTMPRWKMHDDDLESLVQYLIFEDDGGHQ